MKYVGNITIYLLVLFTSVSVTALSVSAMWSWFVVPLGVKAIGLAHAYGISVLIQMLTFNLGDIEQTTKVATEAESKIYYQMFIRIAVLLTGLFFGWIAKGFM